MNSQQSQKLAQPELVALFVSDIHLSPALPKTTSAFLAFLRQKATQAKQLYILGDLFEYWVGDDDIADDYNQKIVTALEVLTTSGVELFWIAGNRDFLAGSLFAETTGAKLLPDPSTVSIAGLNIVICHGDAQCTDDTDYIKFRTMVRNPEWQKQFLSRPLSERKLIVQSMRMNSKSEQAKKDSDIMDVNSEAIAKLFEASACCIMIHGHTHRPARHPETGKYRYVLPDWDVDTNKHRGGWLGIFDDGKIILSDLNGQEI
ncbi:UDP-2,3-diacylglucosamine diphosphatase [Undibacterium sp. 14-3-2]|uniref:UDP-2,3-diacylglucosamine diphosphatase n=1 Tax=Undibacterium sp. 14-3-2 TaxID=2800129 RepID=UPI001906655B|nr:UDP-2,3-diacylglucosamine diphosphatase [Undibacterium sp. 14-3-2]